MADVFDQRFGKDSQTYTLSAQGFSYLANAGGQTAYSLRLMVGEATEYMAFANTTLGSGSLPLAGAMYYRRLPWCTILCPVRAALQLGVGVSTAGPTLAVGWSFIMGWILRMDFETHIYTLPPRPIVWSYPFWVGLSLPF